MEELYLISESLRSKLIDCYSQQLDEIELLTCMYPNKEEISFTDKNVLSEIKNFVDSDTPFKPNHLDFIIKLHVDGLKMELSINLPSFYPIEGPDIYLRCNQLNRQQETALNSDLSLHIKYNHLGEACLYTAIMWLQDNLEKYNTKIPTTNITSNDKEDDEKFARFWIYSHHIYSKKKREDIMKMAKEYNLTGFCLPGKPGIICVEGTEYNCHEWWKIIKSMCWKRITLRQSEIFDVSKKPEEKRFTKFEELQFKTASSKRVNHADMSEFSKYMEQFRLSQVFNDIFGLCNVNNE
ncbi:RWD domain-containing protein 2A [Bicyclus anynana]|uniref:RWD domain-containing protein 2A n=1 Tax=Bicyclus anynana TaxID=110368 RepID=A0A6J1NBX6_BICAN|nr:RWD domain-containing protein 2A [Bicyclus anynana]